MYRAGFIGCGNMGGTLAAVAAESVGGDQILTLDHHREKLEALHKAWGCIPATAEKAAKECRILFLGVKPQVMGKLAEELREPLKSRAAPPLLVSMAAGLSIETVSSLFGGARVLRIMPNTPAAVGEGVLLYAPGPGVTAEDEADFLELMAPAGLCARLPEEKIDAGSAVTGCGPAFVCLMMEAMTEAGVRCGLPRAQARTFALQTFAGTARLALETGTDPAELRGAVCSPAGSTIEGVAALEAHGVRYAVMEAVDAALRRTRELGKS